MARSHTSIADLGRDLATVAGELAAWQRGDPLDAAAETLQLAARNAHARAYSAWVWSASLVDGTPVWLLPVASDDVERFAPRGPMLLLLRCIRAAVASGASSTALRLVDWDGFAALTVGGIDPVLAPIALTDAHPSPALASFADLPTGTTVDGPPLELAPPRAPVGLGITEAAGAIHVHPVTLAGPLLDMGWHLEERTLPAEVVELLRHRGYAGSAPPASGPSLAIEDDPCPRRRHARRVLRRLLHKRKIGEGYHTAIDHLARGTAPEDRATAADTGEALIRAGLLGEKPSVGQRHVYLRRDALPAIHALIERGETSDPVLAAHWTAPEPAGRR